MAEIIHVAIIPDGNRRWARKHGLPAIEGHRVGAERMHQVVDTLIKVGVKYLSVWGFSTDNWKRTRPEVNSLLDLLGLWIKKDTPWLHKNGIKLNHIGRLHELPTRLQEAINQAMGVTKTNVNMTLNLAFNYTGRAEIVDAIRKIISLHIPSEFVNESLVNRYLYTDSTPDVDLVIRTADEFRVSNFMLWQAAYAEYYVSPALWPDFDSQELHKALGAYAARKRRFGGD